MQNRLNGKKRIVGIGSALIDILAFETDEFLQGISDIKGGMTLVDSAFIEDVVGRLSTPPEIVPGGAACNSIIGVGRLGGDAGFVGQCGKDEFGSVFEKDLVQNSVQPELFKSDSSTGRVLSLITPDAQRSMFTYLGASAEMLPENINPSCFENAGIVLIEGYLLFNKNLMMTALKSAKEAGAMIAMDLASFTVVEESLDFLKNEVMSYIDILIANEDEARAFTGISDESESLRILSEYADVAVLKVGARGSSISYGGDVVNVDSVQGDSPIVDTTGAGDLWASGFLFGLVNGYSMEKCGHLGSACGYEVCRVTGASIPDDGWERISRLIHQS